MPTIHWDPKILATVLPWRHPYGARVPPMKERPFDFGKLHAAIAKEAWRIRLDAEQATPEATALVARWRARLAAPATPAFDLTFEGYALFFAANEAPEKTSLAPLVRHWCATAGVVATLDALSLATRTPIDAFRAKGHFLRFTDWTTWVALRNCLVDAPDDVYAAARARAQALAAEVVGHETHAIGLAVAFPDDAALAVPALGFRYPSWSHLLSTTGVTFEQAVALLPDFDPAVHATFLWRWGTDALPKLRAKFEGWGDGPLARLLAQVDDPALGPLFVAKLEEKAIRPHAVAWLEARPALALSLLAPLAQRGTKAAEALVPLVAALERRLTTAAAAPSTAAPDVLANPPWRVKPKDRPRIPKVPGLVTPGTPVRLRPLDPPPPAPDEVPPHVREGLAEALRLNRSFWGLPLLDDSTLRDVAPRLPLDINQARHLVARFGEEAAPWVLAQIDTTDSWTVCQLAALHSPALALGFVRALGQEEQSSTAARWFATDPEVAVRGLVPIALGDQPDRDRAIAVLRQLSDRGADTRSAAAEHGPAAIATMDALLAMDPVWIGLPAKPPTLPSWWDPAGLPPVRLRDGTPLSPDHLRALAELVWFSDLRFPYAGLDIVRAACNPADLEAFGRASASAWMNAGGKSRELGVFFALGAFGNDDTVRWIVENLDQWTRTGSNPTDRFALEMLSVIGTDAALAALARISHRSRHDYLRERATLLLAEHAALHGLHADQLADRTVPDFGLSEALVLDFGPRSFTVRFDEALRPIVHQDDTRLPTLPRPNAHDDPGKAKAASVRFKALVADVEKFAQLQIARLRAALVESRRWNAADFRRHLVDHPLVGHLVRGLVWARFDGPLVPFRVAEDRTYADAHDALLPLPEHASIGLLHPLHVDAAELGRWRERFTEYRLLQPFPQIDRPVYRLTSFEGREAHAPWLHRLTACGWRYASEGPVRPFAGGITARLRMDPPLVKADRHVLGALVVTGGALDTLRTSELVLEIEDAITKG